MSALVLTAVARGPSGSAQPARWAAHQALCRMVNPDRHPGSPSPWDRQGASQQTRTAGNATRPNLLPSM
eukprot:1715927-Lingulodinium_polyedra.AAC.1